MNLTNLGFTTRFMPPTYMNLCASQTLKGAICRLKTKKTGLAKAAARLLFKLYSLQVTLK